MEYKILSIALMAVMMLSIMAVAPVINAEDDSNDTSDLANNTVISNVTLNDSTNETEEADLEMNETAGNGKIAWKEFKLWFTFNEEKIVKAQLEIAKLRLIQAKIAAKNGNEKAMEKALEAHDRILERAKERMAKIDGASDENGLNASADKLVGLERAIQVHELRISLLQNMLNNSNLTAEQRERIEMQIGKAQNVTAKLSELNDEKQEKVKTKLMAIKNMTDEEAQQFMEDKREAMKERLGELKEKKAEIKEKLRVRAGNGNDSEDDNESESEDLNESEED